MRKFILPIYCGFVLVNCSNTASPEPNSESTSQKIMLSSAQTETLNKSLPPKVRAVLENAEVLEILAEVENEYDGVLFEPNRKAVVADPKIKKEILKAFYLDASYGESPTACYIPHHSIRASYAGEKVEIEICYLCRRFFVSSSHGKFRGGFDYENNRKSEGLLNRIIAKNSVELK